MIEMAAAAAGRAVQRCLGPVANAHGLYIEALRQAGIKKQGRLFVRPALITLEGVLTSAIASATDEYRVPADEVLLVREMRGHFAFDNVDGEALALGNFNAMTPEQYVVAKARNCTLLIERADRGVKVTQEASLVLGDILTAVGGAPIRFDEGSPGWIIPPAETLKLTAALIDTAAPGQSSRYGVVMTGSLLSIVSA